ncbi:MAG: NAD(P)H-dependent oxidoreductase [Spirochaetaceae bacterium]|nr:NAD(P)H-dependent oxidoreductase [Spirochaetaceae bacterium]
MMILIIHAHPEPDSFTAALAAAVGEALDSAGKQATVVDLYRIPGQFPPVLDAEELRRKTSLDAAVLRQMKIVEDAEGYVVIHPDWWGGPPAILKGWIDRVLRPETAYELPEGFGHRNPHGLLEGRQALVIVTGDNDSPGPLEDFWVHRVWGFCGVEAGFLYMPGTGQSSLMERNAFKTEAAGRAEACFA